jgi:hypothetical protein
MGARAFPVDGSTSVPFFSLVSFSLFSLSLFSLSLFLWTNADQYGVLTVHDYHPPALDDVLRGCVVCVVPCAVTPSSIRILSGRGHLRYFTPSSPASTGCCTC